MWYYGVILPNCDCFVDDNNNLEIYVDDCLVFTEYDCGLDRDIVYNTLDTLGYL